MSAFCFACAGPLPGAQQAVGLVTCSGRCATDARLVTCDDCGQTVRLVRCVRYDRDGERHQPRCAVSQPAPSYGSVAETDANAPGGQS